MNKEIFKQDLLKDEFRIQYYCEGSYNWFTMSEFLEGKLPEFYNQYKLIKQKEEKYQLELEIKQKEIELEKDKITKFDSKELIDNDGVEILNEINLGKYNSLIRFLISKGYINENYTNYITQFHEGSITINDNAYIMSVQSKEALPFDAPIDNPKKVIERLTVEDFDRTEILNKFIFDELLNNVKTRVKLNKFINVLMLNNNYIPFFENCILDSNFKNKDRLLEYIFIPDDKIWTRIDIRIDEKEDKIKLLEEIIKHIKIELLAKHKQIQEIEEFINENNIIVYDIIIMKQLIEKLKIKYEDISKFIMESEVFNYIIETSSYKINNINILAILVKNNIFEESENKNYEYIQKIENVKEYIDSNINEYMNNIYINLEDMQNNSEDSIIHLLNLENLQTELIDKILQKESIQIKDIEKVNVEIWDKLLENEKIESSYTNVNKYYEKYGLNEILSNYINKKQSIKEIVPLSETQKIEEYLTRNLVKNIIEKNEIKLSLYKEIVLNTNIRYKWLNVSDLDEEKTLFLMENEIFEYSSEMYKRIRKCSNKIFIKYTRKYIRNIQSANIKNINYSIDEINTLIISEEFSESLKNKAIKNIKNEDIENITDEVIDNICNCILKYRMRNNLSINLLMKILNKNRNTEQKVKIIVYNARLVKLENVEEILKTLGDNYLKIIKDRTTPVFKYTIYNENLIAIIKKLGYNIEYYKEENNIKLRGTKRGNPAA